MMMMMNHRRCSGCSKTGHNSRTCPYYSSASRTTVNTVKLFGVRLPMTVGSGSAASLSCSVATPNHSSPSSSDGYYVSDNEPSTPAAKINRHHPPPINKGIPWNEEEHRLFLLGLEKLGKGDWRGISKNFVRSRTPTQVASHAQKYFLRHQQRQSNAPRRKRRSSLFDMFPNMASNSPSLLKEEQVLLGASETSELSNVESVRSLYLSLNSEFEPMEATLEEELSETIMGSSRGTPASPLPGLFRPPYPTLPFSLWPSSSAYSFREDTLILEGRPLH
ncbi:hypothetical protein PIB30_034340 [Stylosanthes scabra]|uniref:Uncharacterized protein n=1 Tax=Stylosanthes scabra TaxID=79078 RepID=A0ABU6UFG4_9FABA|nr:hypothetical protein [Stylosanthes scabra]